MPKGATVHRVLASRDGLAVVDGSTTPDGAYVIAGVPEGAWRVEATASRGDAWFRAQVDAKAGEAFDLVLK